MKILVTGSAGRVGRAIHDRLAPDHEVLGLDIQPSATTDVVASVSDEARVGDALRGVEAVVHVAALHAPHVGRMDDAQFETVNVQATLRLAQQCVQAGVSHLVFTSTTALYGAEPGPRGEAAWVDEDTPPRPRTVYHRSKIAAEQGLAQLVERTGLPVTVLRMSRCFAEPAPLQAVYRLHRGIDVRDVADAHALAALSPRPGLRCFVVSGATPFRRADAQGLMDDAPGRLRARCPELVEAFARRGWPLPASIDRVYDPARAMQALGWRPRYGFEEVLAQLDRRSPEVLPPGHGID